MLPVRLTPVAGLALVLLALVPSAAALSVAPADLPPVAPVAPAAAADGDDGPQGRILVWRFAYYEGEPTVLLLDPADEGRLIPFIDDHTTLGADMRVVSVRWSLPPGALVTFYEKQDGTGREFSIDSPRGADPKVRDLHFWGPVGAWRWTRPDPSFGRIMLFAEPDLKGDRLVRTLDEHAPDVLHSLDATEMDHRVDSLRWLLPAGVTVTIYEHEDGSGEQRIIGPGAGRLERLSEIPDNTFAESWSWTRRTGNGSWLLQPDGNRGTAPFDLHELEPAALQPIQATMTTTTGALLSWVLPDDTCVVLYGEHARGGPAVVLTGEGSGPPRLHPVAWEKRTGDLSQDLTDRRRPYDRNTWLVAQAADASRAEGWTGQWHQSGSLTGLLLSGVRGLELEVLRHDGEMLLVRGDHDWSVGVGRGGTACRPLESALQAVAGFLETHPADVVTLFLAQADAGGPGALDEQELREALRLVGLGDQVFDPRTGRLTDDDDGPRDTWPTPAELVAADRRLVLFVEGLDDDGTTRGLPRPRTWRPARSNLANFGSSTIETLLDARALRAELDDWMARHGDPPTFIAVDFATRGGRGGPRRVVRELNAERGHDP